MSKQIIATEYAPAAVATYSQGIVAEGKFLFVSGQVGIDPATGKMAGDSIEVQAKQVLENLKNIVEASGATLKDVVKVTVLLSTIDDYAAVNAIYNDYFSEAPPARAAFGGLQLPLGALVEIECVALISN